MKSKNWNRIWNGKRAILFKTIKERTSIVLKMIKGKKILDVGCGSGELINKLNNKRKLVYGIDFSKIMLNNCKNGYVLNANAENIPFKDKYFDCITALGLIEYLKTDNKFIKESHRILKDNGILIISYRNKLFSKYSGRIFEPERRSHNPNNLKYDGFKLIEVKYFHKHKVKFDDDKLNYSAFVAKFIKLKKKVRK